MERIPNSYRIYMLKGMVEAKQARYVEAIKCCGTAVELNPGSPEANFNLARVQSLAALTKEAEATFEHGIKQFPHDALTYQEYALMLLRLVETGDSKAESRAVSLLEAAIAQDRSVAEPQFQLGNLWLREEKVAAALEELKEAEKLDPKNSKIHFALSRAYRHLGRTKEAAKEFELYQSAKAEEEKATTAFFIEPAKHLEP